MFNQECFGLSKTNIHIFCGHYSNKQIYDIGKIFLSFNEAPINILSIGLKLNLHGYSVHYSIYFMKDKWYHNGFDDQLYRNLILWIKLYFSNWLQILTIKSSVT